MGHTSHLQAPGTHSKKTALPSGLVEKLGARLALSPVSTASRVSAIGTERNSFHFYF